ncbi:pilus assembly PilX N-terminal domain-containing protein [Candidatus Peregrinibacteria bacterium]|nr:pilus assembly PilX N-terminal domain-containing protein [Candidatus Peregrinibacteria bacterium]
MKIINQQKGSALVIALLIMGILMTMALGLSNLVIREVKINSDIIGSEKAYYSAEAGIESAMLDLHQNIQGYEVEKTGISDPELGLDFEYSIKNRTKVIPYMDTEIINPQIAMGLPKEYLYNVLNLNESVTIPLFTINQSGQTVPVTDFRVEYFMPDDTLAQNWLEKNWTTADIPILRWKIIGLNKNPPDGKKTFITESIGDYIGVSPGSNETSPSCLGTEDALNKFIDVGGINYQAACINGIWFCARESYFFGIGESGGLETRKYSAGTDNIEIYNCNTGNPLRIYDFIAGAEKHENNYLTLTNVFNPVVLSGYSDYEKINKAKIYYRIIIPNDNEYIVREQAKITSTGYFRTLRKQIEAFIKPNTFMPVFNFSLYRTDVKSSNDLESPEGFK